MSETRTKEQVLKKIEEIKEAYPNIDNEAIGGNPIKGFVHGAYCAYLWFIKEIEEEELDQ